MDNLTTTGNQFIDLNLNFKIQFRTSSGIRCIVDQSLTDYAKRKELENVFVVLTFTKDDQPMEYLLIESQEPSFASQKREDIAVHIDMLKMANSR